jgi:hypothetical protein
MASLPIDDQSAGSTRWVRSPRCCRSRGRSRVRPARSAGGQRRCSRRQIAEVLRARVLAGDGLTLAGIRQAASSCCMAASVVTLGGPDDAAALAAAAGQDGIHVIIDYLWGQPAEAAIAAISRRGPTHTAPRVRLVEVGGMDGPVICLPADVLRSSGLEILGSGPGTIPLAEIIGAIPQFMAIAAAGGLASPRWRRAAGRPPALRPARTRPLARQLRRDPAGRYPVKDVAAGPEPGQQHDPAVAPTVAVPEVVGEHW